MGRFGMNIIRGKKGSIQIVLLSSIVLWLSAAQSFGTVDVQPLNVTRGSSSVAPGASLSVSWQIRNNGSSAAASSQSQVRITSSGSSYGNSANNVGSAVATGTIAAGATINQSTTVTVPASLAPGTYYVWVVADNTSVLTQTTTANDYAVSASFTVASAGTVDVEPLNVTRGSSTVAPGASLSVSWQIRNNGSSAAASSQSQVRITSSGSSYGNSANNVGSGVATGTIAAGATINQSTTVTVPASLAPGTYYVWVIADNTSVLTQTTTANDYAVSASFTVAGTVDVETLNVTRGSSSVAPGASLSVSWQIRNNGSSAAASSQSQVRITSSGSSYGNSANNVGSAVATGTIAAGATINQSTTVTVPASLAPGTYYVWVIADNTSVLTQTTTANDYAVSASFTVAGTVDVETLNVTRGSSSVAPGASLSVSWQIRNNGSSAAASSQSQVRITSSGSSYGNSANNVGSAVATGTIAAGATINQSTTVTVPASLAPGTYYVWVVADNTSVLTQTTTANDYAVSASFTVAGTVDVETLNVTRGSSSVAPGASLSVSWQIRNNGSSAAASSQSQVRITSSGSSYGNSANNVGSGVATGTIAAGATINQSTTVTVPASLAPGTYYVWVIADNTSVLTQTTTANDYAVSASFTVAGTAPSITSVSPTSMPPLNSDQTLTIYGNNFQNGATLTFDPPTGANINSTAAKLTFVSSTQISYQINNGSDSGTWTVKVNNPDGQSSGTMSFTVTTVVLAPSITSVSPTSMPPLNSDQTLTIYGNNFQNGATLTFDPPTGANINSTAAKLTFVSSTQINYQINNGSDFGTWTVKVNNPDGQSSGTMSFTVTTVVLAPSITSVSPTSMPPLNSDQTLTIYGNNFQNGATLTFDPPTGANINSTAAKLTFVSSTQINYQLNNGSDSGTWTVKVNNPDGKSSGTMSFSVQTAGTPSLAVTSPTSTTTWTAGTSQTISWTVNGTPNPSVSYFALNYSLNGGTAWQPYGYFASGSAVSGSWSIPTTANSSQAIVQIIAVNSSGLAMFWNQSAAFTISSQTTGTPTSVPNCNNRSPSPASAVTITFNGAASTGSSTSCGIASYLWTFGDGGTGTGSYPSHTYYPSPGSVTTYNVYLQVTDSCGKIAANTQPLIITITGQALGNSNPAQPTSKDPVNLATGNYTYNHVDLRLPGRGLPFEFQRFYNSKATASTGLPLGYGWTDSYNIGLAVSQTNNAVVITFGDGHAEMYATNGAGGYFSQPGIYNVLATSGGNYTLTTKEQQKYNFNSSGQLTSIADKNNNAVSLGYTGIALTTITNTVGRVISFAYNANNCLTNITDPLGRTVRFAYDANTNLVSVTDTRGGLTQFGYDQYHQVTNAIDPRGNTFVSMQYDNLQRVVSSQKDALQGATTFTYDFVSGITTVVDAMTNVSYYHYDPQLRVKEIDDNLGNKQFFQYDTNNNRIQVIDKNGKSTAYAYDANGNVISKTDPFAQPTTIAYDALNNPTNRLDAQNGLTIFKYDPKGNLTNTFNSIGKTNTYQYDAFGEPVIVQDANGNITTNAYDSFGNLILTRDAVGGTNAFAYDAASRKLKSVDALGHTNLFIYDSADNLTASVNALGKTNSFIYDGNNNRVSATDFRGYTTTSIYDVKDRLIITRDALGNSVTNDYDALDRKIRVWDAMGGVTRFGYDANGNLLAVTNAVNAVTRYSYDPNGNRTNTVDALGNSITNVFDSLNRLVSTQDALGRTTASVYDALGRRLQGIDPLNRTNFFAYDRMGRLTNFTDTAGGTVVNAYDNVGNRLFTTDPNGHTTTNVFDALNRLSQTTDPVGGVTQLGYDAVGSLVSRKDPNGKTTTYLYDANNRRTQITYPTGTPVTFGYDNNGNRTSMTDALGTTTYLYDALNRLTSVTDCYGKTVSYAYDKNGNRTSITYPGGKTVTYAYDAINRLKTVTDWQYNTTTYSYDANGNLTSSINPNGSAAVYKYDLANRLLALTNTINSAIISSYQYNLDAIGNHSQVNQTEPLPTIPVVGQSTSAYDNDSKQITLDGQAQGFDANGNMTSVNPTNLLAYDYENRLVQTSFTDATSTYQYDGAGNRLSANRDGVVTRYILDRNTPLAQVLAETDSSGNVIYYYIYGLGLVSRIDAGGNAQYYHYDSRGSTIAMTDASGKITEAYAYDPFGRPINGQLSDNRFRYLGRHGVVDEENGLLYIRARYYSTKRGRFITKDPTTGQLGDSQSLNRFIYALNNPVRLIDISGFVSQDSSGNQVSPSAPTDPSFWNKYVLNATVIDTSVKISLEMAGAIGKFYAAGAGLNGIPINFSLFTKEVTGQLALPLYNPTSAQIGNIVSKSAPIVGLIAGGALNTYNYSQEHPDASYLELASRFTANVGFQAAATAGGAAVGGLVGSVFPGAGTAAGAVVGGVVGFGLGAAYNVFQDDIQNGIINPAGNWLYQTTGF